MAHDRRSVVWRWTGVLTLWHVAPKPRACRAPVGQPYNQRWRWHVHHWRLSFDLLPRLRRWLFGRCEVCGGRWPWPPIALRYHHNGEELSIHPACRPDLSNIDQVLRTIVGGPR